jgi:hypothetical protein
LFILTQLASSFYAQNNSLVSRNVCLFDSEKLVKKYQLENLIFNNWNKKYDSLPEHERDSALHFKYEYSPRWYMISNWENKGIRKVDKEKLVNAIKRIIMDACEVIDIHLFSDFELEDEWMKRNKDMNNYWEESHRETMFYEDFINEKATLDDWKKHPYTSFRQYFEYHGSGTEEGWNRLNAYQTKLFNQALQEEISILKEELLSLPEPNKQDNASTQLAIIRKFLTGEFSQLDYKRLNQIIEFSDPDQVILELDDMSRYDVYNYDRYIPYNGENNKKSPRFVASLLTEYKKFLERVLHEYTIPKSVMSGLDEDLSAFFDEEKPKLPKPSSFRLILKPDKEAILKKVTAELIKFDFIDMDKHTISELNNIFLCSNFKEIKNPVQFGSQTNFCCQILKEFFPYFENMNAASIAQSGLFKTQSGRLLTQTNFNKSVKAGSKKEGELAEIKKIIRQLEEKNSKSSKN